MQVRAVARYIGLSPRKVRLVVDTVRGKPVGEALAVLRYLPNAAAREVAKVVKSAVANAEQNNHLSAEDLYIASISADEGPSLKRWRPGARGRANPIRKRSSHITVVVAEKEVR
ncbi:MAG: 50S ribosomal protein L22 [Chloroflexi bacterium]|nr:50S ribosomal protein L22 [Chloroflexota bacterium]MBI5956509.1 50S ribosomal protein L22 [Chloroflexota bacterium]